MRKNSPREARATTKADRCATWISRHRLMRYPCSYMIYSPAFDALPAEAKEAIYRRMWQILSGQEKEKKYARLSPADRRAIVEILRDTKPDLPDYFK